MDLSITELAVVVIAGLFAGTYAKSEGCSSFLAAVVGVLTAVIIVLVAGV